MLFDINPDILEAAAKDDAFLSLYDDAIAAFDNELNNGESWYASGHAGSLAG